MTTFTASPQLTVTKTATLNDDDGTSGLSAGDTISYTITAENTGDVTLSSVSLTDALTPTGGSARSLSPTLDSSSDTGSDSVISVGETWTWTHSYTVLQSDIDAGGVSNLATVTADDPSGTELVVQSSASGNATPGSSGGTGTVTTFTASPQLTVTKTVDDSDLNDGVRPGDKMHYTITIKNTGNVTLTSVSLVDTISDLDGNELSLDADPVKSSDSGANPNDTSMEVNDVWVFVASYTLTQSSISSGGVENLAVVSGLSPSGATVSAESKVGGNTSDSQTGAPTRTGFPGEISGVVKQYQSPVHNVTVKLFIKNGSGDYEPVPDPQNQGSYLTTQSDSNGEYSFLGLEPGIYAVEFVNSSSSVPRAQSNNFTESGALITEITLGAGAVEIEQNAFLIDPSGVVYDSSTYSPITGAVVTLYHQATVGSAPVKVSDSWLDTVLGDSNEKVTGSDGLYSFFLNPSVAPDGIYSIGVIKTGYQFESQNIAALNGPYDPGLGGGVVSISPDTQPSESMNTDYYLSFAFVFDSLAANTSNGVINNHIPLDSSDDLLSEVKDQLKDILKDDLLETIKKQSHKMSGYASSGLDRLKGISEDSCSSDLGRILDERPVLFVGNSSRLSEDDKVVLRDVAAILQSCKRKFYEIEVSVIGDSSNFNDLTLSDSRAKAVFDQLVEYGVLSSRLSQKGILSASFGVILHELNMNSLSQGCIEKSKLDPKYFISINQDGVQMDGKFSNEKRNCESNSWEIFEGDITYSSNDSGIDQGMGSLSYRNETLETSASLSGHFMGLYVSDSNVSEGSASGKISGVGINAGIYGANRAESDLYVDHFFGGAVGRHGFDLNFDNSSGLISADGSYKYLALFGGVAVSGSSSYEDYDFSPRIGVEMAWSPGGKAEVDLAQGDLRDSGDFSISGVTGARLFAEVSFEDLLPHEDVEFQASPKVFCDRELSANETSCGLGISVELSEFNEDTYEKSSLRLFAEKTKDSHSYGLSLGFGSHVLDGDLDSSASINQNGESSVDLKYTYKLD